MKELPIMFSAPMVQALLAGRKTQTRRLASSPLVRASKGDRLWVRETFGCHWATDDQKPSEMDPELWSVRYYADDHIRPARRDGSLATIDQFKKKHPAIHMPRWASRLTLELEDVRVEPLQSISPADAIAEGVTDEMVGRCVREFDNPLPSDSWVGGYAWLWSSLHGRQSWDDNPDVVVLTFQVLR